MSTFSDLVHNAGQQKSRTSVHNPVFLATLSRNVRIKHSVIVELQPVAIKRVSLYVRVVRYKSNEC